MEREKEQWIDKAMNSLNDIQPAIEPANLHRNIMQRIQHERRRIITDVVQAKTIYRAAAAILIIITVNIFTCVSISKSVTKQKQLQSFAKQYSLSDTGDGFLNI